MDRRANHIDKTVIFSTPIMRVLDFLLTNPDLQFSDTDINRAKIGVKRSAVNSALRTLSDIGLIERTKQGRSSVNRLAQTRPVIGFLKIVSNLLELEPIVKKCRSFTYKISNWPA